jgi:hypothetical protein
MTVQGARAALSPAIGSWIAQWRGYGTAFIALGLLTVGAIVVWLTFAGLSRPFWSVLTWCHSEAHRRVSQEVSRHGGRVLYRAAEADLVIM